MRKAPAKKATVKNAVPESAIVVIAASTGGLGPLRKIISAFSADFNCSIFVLHRGPYPSLLPAILASKSALPVTFAENGGTIEAGHVYVAPPDQHIALDPGRVRLSRRPKALRNRPAADPLFISAAEAYADRVIGIVLNGDDGSAGLRAIKNRGGMALVLQRPDDAVKPPMPLATIADDYPDACLTVDEISHVLAEWCVDHPATRGRYVDNI